MTRIGSTLLFCVVAFCVSLSETHAANSGAISVEERRGQALAFSFNNRCLGLTAAHVIEEAVAGSVRLEGAPLMDLRFEVLAVEDDVALLQIDTADRPEICEDQPLLSESTKALLDLDTSIRIEILDGSSIGIVGGSVTGIENSRGEIEMRPVLIRDSRIERGISGSPMLIQGKPVAIVTDVKGVGNDPVFVGVGIDKIRKYFPVHLPQINSSIGSNTRNSYDLAQLSGDFRSAMIEIKKNIRLAEDAAERGQALAMDAQLAAKRAVPVPNDYHSLKKEQAYFWPGGTGEVEARGQLSATLKDSGQRFSYNLHGLGLSEFVAGDLAGKVLEGRFINGILRAGVLKKGVKPSRPNGYDQLKGSWDENGQLQLGVWTLENGRVLVGRFKTLEDRMDTSILISGRSVYPDGSAIDMHWTEQGPGRRGYCVQWDKLGQLTYASFCMQLQGMTSPFPTASQ